MVEQELEQKVFIKEFTERFSLDVSRYILPFYNSSYFMSSKLVICEELRICSLYWPETEREKLGIYLG